MRAAIWDGVAAGGQYRGRAARRRPCYAERCKTQAARVSSVSTVLWYRGFRVMIHLPPREHGPAHVHVWKDGQEAVIELQPMRFRIPVHMRTADMVIAMELVRDNLELLLEEWRERHG